MESYRLMNGFDGREERQATESGTTSPGDPQIHSSDRAILKALQARTPFFASRSLQKYLDLSRDRSSVEVALSPEKRTPCVQDNADTVRAKSAHRGDRCRPRNCRHEASPTISGINVPIPSGSPMSSFVREVPARKHPWLCVGFFCETPWAHSERNNKRAANVEWHTM